MDTSAFQLNEKLPTDLKKVNPFVEKVFKQIGILARNKEQAYQVKLALEEALTNAIRHGNLLDPAKWVQVRIKADRKQVILDVHDQGKGFAYQSIPDPTRKENAAKPSGRGIFLIHRNMDAVEFYDRGAGLRMSKDLI
jgi:serine/threonine-protein kinase RsbW